MLIANPIYDTVFKYLFEDEEIARGLLSELLAEEVSSVEFRSQELVAEQRTSHLAIFRLDFLALVHTASGARKVLIEMQKARSLLDIDRFRRYLAEHYRRRDRLAGQEHDQPLPIITIYFLGFTLSLNPAIIKVERKYVDALSGETLTQAPKEDFLELLTHDSYSIQIPRLAARAQSRLEELLQVFRQDGLTADSHEIDYQGTSDDPLVGRMLERLRRAAASTELRRQMDAEDELERLYEKELKGKDLLIQAKDQQLEEKNKELLHALDAKQEALDAKQEALDAKQEALDAKQEALDAKQEALDAKQEALDANARQAEALAAMQRELDALRKRL